MTSAHGSTSSLRYDRRMEGHGGIAEGGSHWWLVHRVPAASRVLDCGCAGGYLAAALRARECQVDGIELDPDAAEAARQFCSTVFIGSLEDPAVIDRVPAFYDRIILGDVLEHLAEPELLLRRLAPRLVPGGRMLLSLPNIAHWSARWHLLRGRFEYTDFGLFDRTHLRFFTYETAAALAASADLRVVCQEFTTVPLLPVKLIARAAGRAHRAFPNLFAYQTLLELDVPPAGRSGG